MEERQTQPLEIRRTISRTEAEEALQILNGYFSTRPEERLIQRPRTTYDKDGKGKVTMRYQIRTAQEE